MLVCTLLMSSSHAGSLNAGSAANILSSTVSAPSFRPIEIHQGRVSVVSSGDTITIVREDHQAVRVQLAGLDAPEQDQPWGFQAKQQLSKTIFDRQVAVHEVSKDSFGNVIGRVWLADFNVNEAQLSAGNAWLLQGTQDPVLVAAEQQAREKRMGLWALPAEQIVAPWDWRDQHHQSKETPPKAGNPLQSAECGSKKSCVEMSSCEEATHYLKNCGARVLDWDGDGIPCRSLCR